MSKVDQMTNHMKKDGTLYNDNARVTMYEGLAKQAEQQVKELTAKVDQLEGAVKIDVEAFKKAVAKDVADQYPRVDYLRLNIPIAMDKHKGLIVVSQHLPTEVSK